MLNIPQKLTAWKVSEEATNTKIKADGAHQCYLSITCKSSSPEVICWVQQIVTEQFMFRSEIHG